MSFVGSLLLSTAAAEPPIVVTAPRTKEALADCVKGQCDLREDAIASIRHAQAQFANGQYPNARKTLLASLARNRHRQAGDPRAISALWYALARVTLHNGDMQEYRKAALRSGSILARAESVTPSERVRGETQIADALSMTGDSEGAVRRYRRIGEAARERGDIELAELMELRSIFAQSTFDGRPAARRKLERAATDPALTPLARTAARGLAAQLQEGTNARALKLLDEVPAQAADAPLLLLLSPPTRMAQQRQAINRALANNDSTLFAMLQPRSSEARLYSWADIGFWVRPDGKVEGAEVLRGSRNRDWADDVVRTVLGRRYAPFEAPPGSEGRYKIERVTLTYDHQVPAGSLIRRRSGLPTYRFEELKIENPAPGP